MKPDLECAALFTLVNRPKITSALPGFRAISRLLTGVCRCDVFFSGKDSGIYLFFVDSGDSVCRPHTCWTRAGESDEVSADLVYGYQKLCTKPTAGAV